MILGVALTWFLFPNHEPILLNFEGGSRAVFAEKISKSLGQPVVGLNGGVLPAVEASAKNAEEFVQKVNVALAKKGIALQKVTVEEKDKEPRLVGYTLSPTRFPSEWLASEEAETNRRDPRGSTTLIAAGETLARDGDARLAKHVGIRNGRVFIEDSAPVLIKDLSAAWKGLSWHWVFGESGFVSAGEPGSQKDFLTLVATALGGEYDAKQNRIELSPQTIKRLWSGNLDALPTRSDLDKANLELGRYLAQNVSDADIRKVYETPYSIHEFPVSDSKLKDLFFRRFKLIDMFVTTDLETGAGFFFRDLPVTRIDLMLMPLGRFGGVHHTPDGKARIR